MNTPCTDRSRWRSAASLAVEPPLTPPPTPPLGCLTGKRPPGLPLSSDPDRRSVPRLNVVYFRYLKWHSNICLSLNVCTLQKQSCCCTPSHTFYCNKSQLTDQNSYSARFDFFHPWLHLCNMQIKFKQKMMLDFTSAVHKHLVTKLRSFYFCMCVYISMCIHLQIHIKFYACLNRLPAIFVFSLFFLPVVFLCFVVFDCSLFSILFISLTFMTVKQVCCKGHKTTGFTSSIFLIKSRHLKKKVE